jgi:thiol:disulfide interchange protein DsbC
MLLMLRLLATTLLLSSFIYADTSDKIEDFLSNQFSKNTRLKSVDVSIDSKMPLEDLKGWDAYIVNIKAVLKNKPEQVIEQKMVWFSNGTVVTKDLTDLHSGDNYADLIKPDFKNKYYTKENLIYGDENAKHKIAIFSDPLCPFCKSFVPAALKDMQKEPNKYAVYYYHLPLERIHPASVALVRIAQAAQLQGVKDVIIKMYSIQLNPVEKDINIILAAFNKAVGSDIKLSDIKTKKVEEQVHFDSKVANDIMVGGTPTIYIDGKIDRTKNKYKKVK